MSSYRSSADALALAPVTTLAASPVATTTATAVVTKTPRAATTSKKKKKKKKTATRTRGKNLHLRTRELLRFRCHNLELDLMNLRQEIATLESMRKLLYARALHRADALDGSVLKTVRHFYALLRHGFNDYVWLDENDAGRSGGAALDFRQFIEASFDEVLAVGPDLARKEPRGRDHLVEHLAHMTALTGAPNVQMLDLHLQPALDGRTATVVVKTMCTSPLSVLLLEAMYAHVSLYPELKHKLVGRAIAAYGEARYVFDLATGRIILADVRADHASAILQVVDTADEYEILYGGRSDTALAEMLEAAAADATTTDASTNSLTSLDDDDDDDASGAVEPDDLAEPMPTRRSAMSLQFVLS